MNHGHTPIHERRTRPRLSLKLHDDLAFFGVPREEHTLEGLRARFPAALKIEQSGFDLETTAEVLIHLIRSGIIKPS